MSQPILVLSFAIAFGALATALIARLLSATTWAVRAVQLAALAVLTAAAAFAFLGSGLHINFTPSMPLGIYRLEALPAGGVKRGMFVAVCAPPDAAELGRRRGYLSTGPCPHDTELLLKAVAGVAGDEVMLSARGVAVDGRLLPHSRPVALDRSGRRMSPWPAGRYYLGPEQVWLDADNDRSWDSRYWGPATTASIIARAVPMLTVPSFRSASGEPGCGAAHSAGAASSPDCKQASGAIVGSPQADHKKIDLSRGSSPLRRLTIPGTL